VVTWQATTLHTSPQPSIETEAGSITKFSQDATIRLASRTADAIGHTVSCYPLRVDGTYGTALTTTGWFTWDALTERLEYEIPAGTFTRGTSYAVIGRIAIGSKLLEPLVTVVICVA
jgi:hypothetical protein